MAAKFNLTPTPHHSTNKTYSEAIPLHKYDDG